MYLPHSAGLVPFTFTGALHEIMQRLSGISVRAAVTANGTTFTEDILFTHRGLSGPAILQASSFWQPGDVIDIDLLPGTMRRSGSSQRNRHSRRRCCVRPGRVFCPGTGCRIAGPPLAPTWRRYPWPNSATMSCARSATRSTAGRIKPAATEGYRTAEVTLGGVDTSELSSKTMESRRQPGLYFIGEVVDVTGHLGGFNFQWAWSSGHAAGRRRLIC